MVKRRKSSSSFLKEVYTVAEARRLRAEAHYLELEKRKKALPISCLKALNVKSKTTF